MLDKLHADERQHAYVSIRDSMNLSMLIGARLFVGYGPEDQEMLVADRYPEIYIAQPDTRRQGMRKQLAEALAVDGSDVVARMGGSLMTAKRTLARKGVGQRNPFNHCFASNE